MERHDYYLRKADENLPTIYQTIHNPIDFSPVLSNGSVMKFDLDEHCVVYSSFHICTFNIYLDEPICLKIRCTESKRELESDHTSYKGWLSPTWLPEETMMLDDINYFMLPCRFGCRYIRVEVVYIPRPILLQYIKFIAQTSANVSSVSTLKTTDLKLVVMDNISHNTLRDCVQRIFEDGPKRDHRLWIGNLRIQALTAYSLFAEEELVRRCFYLLAVSVRNEDGFISSFIYKSNCYYSGETHLIDYALLFVVTDCDYYENTGDLATVKDLLELCKEQINSVCSLLDRNRTISPRSYWWTFIDWMPGLEKNTASQGVYLYTLDWFSNLLRSVGDCSVDFYLQKLEDGRVAARTYLYDEEPKVFCNEIDNYDLSIHSQIWIILGGAIDGGSTVHIA